MPRPPSSGAVDSEDGMTADWVPFSDDVLKKDQQPHRERNARINRVLRHHVQAAGDD
jgi:GMP synthase PP-ATPase subunit